MAALVLSHRRIYVLSSEFCDKVCATIITDSSPSVRLALGPVLLIMVWFGLDTLLDFPSSYRGSLTTEITDDS